MQRDDAPEFVGEPLSNYAADHTANLADRLLGPWVPDGGESDYRVDGEGDPFRADFVRGLSYVIHRVLGHIEDQAADNPGITRRESSSREEPGQCLNGDLLHARRIVRSSADIKSLARSSSSKDPKRRIAAQIAGPSDGSARSQ